MNIPSQISKVASGVGSSIDARYNALMMLAGALSIFHANERAQGNGIVGTVITTVVVAIVGIVGILIYSNVEDAVPLDIAGARDDPDNATALENEAVGLSDGFGSAIELLPVVLIVLIASLVIIVIGGMRAR